MPNFRVPTTVSIVDDLGISLDAGIEPRDEAEDSEGSNVRSSTARDECSDSEGSLTVRRAVTEGVQKAEIVEVSVFRVRSCGHRR